MRAGILCVGTELLMGTTVNTNAAELGRYLGELGIRVLYQYTVGDNKERIVEAVRQLTATCEVLITTGGLGPTLDDLTKEAVAEALQRPMVLDTEAMDIIRGYFQSAGREMPSNNLRQAYFPEGATILPNAMGTAPGCLCETDSGHIVAVLPGPPREMRHVYEAHVKPVLSRMNTQTLYSQYLSIYGIGESDLEMRLMSLFESQTNPTLATYAGDGRILLRVTAHADALEAAQLSVEQTASTIKAALGKRVVSDRGETIEQVVLETLSNKKLTLSAAESCTGGLLMHTLISVPGASESVRAGYVTYANSEKIQTLGVDADVLAQYGAVSETVCEAMALGARRRSESDVAISITGIAGPGGGTDAKPVGLVYIGIAFRDTCLVYKHIFPGDRQWVRRRAVNAALVHLNGILEAHFK